MSRIGIKDIAAAVAERHKLTKEEAELFITQMINVINEGLHYDKQLKIKGLGTFKIQSVSARKSVDVNTGSEIEIAGREKITYTPDAVLRDLVNRPFSAFETTVLNDNVDFSDLDEGVEEPRDDESADSGPAEGYNPQVKVEQNTEEERIPDEAVKSDAVYEKQQATDEDTINDTLVNDEKPVEGPLTDEKKADKETSEMPQEDVVPMVDVNIDDDSGKNMRSRKESGNEPNDKAGSGADAENKTLASANEMLQEQVAQFKKLTNIFGIVAVLLLVVLIGGFVYLSGQLHKRDNRIDNLVAQMHLSKANSRDIAAQKATAKPAITDSNLVAGELSKVVERQVSETKDAAAKSESNEKTVKEPVSAEAKTAVTPTPKPLEQILQSQYDSDPRVRTGAYSIVGVDKVITVAKGQTLKSISKAYLGPGMECYVEALNGGVREIKEGEKIKIPKLKLKKKK